MKLRENIAYLISSNRLKLVEFGEIIGVSEAVAGSYRSGKTLPKYSTLLKISSMFNISCDDLLKNYLGNKEYYTDSTVGKYGANSFPYPVGYSSVKKHKLNDRLVHLLKTDPAVIDVLKNHNRIALSEHQEIERIYKAIEHIELTKQKSA